jgi:hypothetical protein
MRGKWMKYMEALFASALGIAGAVAIAAASPASAAPIVLGTATVKELASTQVTGVNCRRRYYGRGYYVRRFYHPRYAHSYWSYNYTSTDCGYTFPAACKYPHPYFGFVYGWHGVW